MAGRPEKPIDWDLVDRLIECQCPADEIAGNFDITRETLYDKIKDKYNVNFTNYSCALRSKGKSKLRLKQWEKAEEGNIPMLLKLGQIHLDQAQIIDSDIKVTINDARSYIAPPVQMPNLSGPSMDSDTAGC
jgi:predicted DNA-binding protein YlxM (UPF0122 family)